MINFGIYAIFTGNYKNYFNNFINSLENFLPNEHKELIVLSDGLENENNKNINNIHITIRTIINFPYPYINMNKFQIINEYNKEFNYEYIMYFDSDTIFLNKDENFWNSFKQKIISNKIIISYHPFYSNTYYYELYNHNIFEFMAVGDINYRNRDFRDYDDANYVNTNFINENKCWLITSFFIMNSNSLKETSEKIKILIQKCNREYLFVLKLSDESHFNLLYYFDSINNLSNKYDICQYIIDNKDEQNNYNDAFILQKYNDDNKNVSKYCNYGNVILLYVDDNFDQNFLYKLYSKYIYNFKFYILTSTNYNVFVNYILNRFMFSRCFTFYNEWFTKNNILFHREFYDEYMSSYENSPFKNFLFIKEPNEKIFDIDFNELIEDNVQYKSDKTLEENKNFMNISYMYYTDEFIKQHYIE